MRIFYLLALSICLYGCNKPNPHPENIDPIYADLQKRLADAKKNYDEQKKVVEGFQKGQQEVKPQTGQNKYADKRLYESIAKLDKFEQMLKYYEIRVQSRLRFAREEYTKAWNNKEKWPNPNEYTEYLSSVETEGRKLSWNAADRIKRFLKENPQLNQNNSGDKIKDEESKKSVGEH